LSTGQAVTDEIKREGACEERGKIKYFARQHRERVEKVCTAYLNGMKRVDKGELTEQDLRSDLRRRFEIVKDETLDNMLCRRSSKMSVDALRVTEELLISRYHDVLLSVSSAAEGIDAYIKQLSDMDWMTMVAVEDNDGKVKSVTAAEKVKQLLTEKVNILTKAFDPIKAFLPRNVINIDVGGNLPSNLSDLDRELEIEAARLHGKIENAEEANFEVEGESN